MKYYVLATAALLVGLGLGFRGEILNALHLHDHSDSHVHAEKDRDRDRDRQKGSRQTVEFRWSGQVSQGDWVEIKGINGGITAVGGNSRDVVVTAEKTSRKGRADEVRIEVLEHGDGVTICSIYPSSRRRNECAAGDEGTLNSRNSDVVVQYRVELPTGVKFRGVTVNGAVSATGLTDVARLATVNGDLNLETEAWGYAQTVNGSIEAAVGQLSSDLDLNFATTNGAITVAVPSDVAADFEGRTLSGRIESAFPMTLSGRYGQRRLEGSLGGGGSLIKMATVNGSIRLIERY